MVGTKINYAKFSRKYERSLFSFFAKMAHENAKISIIAKLDFRRKKENFAFRENKVYKIKQHPAILLTVHPSHQTSDHPSNRSL
jgi:hypothetical protein